MIREYNLTINDETYHIKLETLGASSSLPPRKTAAAAPVYPAPAPQAAPAPQTAPAASIPSGGEKERILTPMPGNVWKVLKKPGDAVKKGDTVIVLEAMKMENEIMASVDGIIAELPVTEGQSLDTNALICVIR